MHIARDISPIPINNSGNKISWFPPKKLVYHHLHVSSVLGQYIRMISEGCEAYEDLEDWGWNTLHFEIY